MSLPLQSLPYSIVRHPISSPNLFVQPLVRSHVSPILSQSSSTQLSHDTPGAQTLPSFQNLWQSIQGPEEPPCSFNLNIPPEMQRFDRNSFGHATITVRPTLLLDTRRTSSPALIQCFDEPSPSGRQSAAPSESSDAFSDLSSVDSVSEDYKRSNEAALSHVIECDDPTTRDLWEAYIQKVGAKDKGNDLVMCVHAKKQKKVRAKAEATVNVDQPLETCGYVALKQTVKRHINSTHLGISPFMCTFCGSRFSQRQAAVIHVNGSHLGVKNIECEYCPERFSDPSRKNKHISKMHQDVIYAVRSRRKNPYAHVSRKR